MGATFRKINGESKFIADRRLSAFKKLKNFPSSIFRYGFNIVTDFEVNVNSPSKSAVFEIKNNGKASVLNLYESQLLKENFMKHIKIDNKPLAINTAFLNSGVVIHLPKKTDCGEIYLMLKDSDNCFSYILVIAEEGSKATIIEGVSSKKANYRSNVIEILAKPYSEVKFGSVQKLPEGKNFVYKKAVIESNANVEWLDIATGSTLTKSEVYSDLVGDGSKSTMFSVFFGSGKQQFDLLNKCTHIGRNTESLILSSGVLTGTAKAIQQSTAKICDKAYNATAHQRAKTLLLNEGAKALPIPKLEIDNNDVVATHQAAVSQIDADKMFYLMSRGLTEKNAKKVFVEGFFEQFVSKIAIPKLREDVETIVANRMENA